MVIAIALHRTHAHQKDDKGIMSVVMSTFINCHSSIRRMHSQPGPAHYLQKPVIHLFYHCK
eukprot:scaffold224601_cov20-Prasinocladus_malaysianus.AAC.1